MSELAFIEEELEGLYRRQSEAERADLDGRVADRAEWRDALRRRSERIRDLERERARLRMTIGDEAA